MRRAGRGLRPIRAHRGGKVAARDASAPPIRTIPDTFRRADLPRNSAFYGRHEPTSPIRSESSLHSGPVEPRQARWALPMTSCTSVEGYMVIVGNAVLAFGIISVFGAAVHNNHRANAASPPVATVETAAAFEGFTSSSRRPSRATWPSPTMVGASPSNEHGRQPGHRRRQSGVHRQGYRYGPRGQPQAAAFLVQLVRGLTISPVGGDSPACRSRRPRARPRRRDGWRDRLPPEPIRPS